MRRSLSISATTLLLLAAAGFYAAVLWPLRDKHPPLQLLPGSLAVRGATVYISPDRPPLPDATLLTRDGRIVAVGGPGLALPAGTRILPCNRCVVTAGFWNTHVHFTERKWLGAPWASQAVLDDQLADMLTSHGFTSVVDTGSDLRVTVSLRRRIESGDLRGPHIDTAGAAIYPEHGIPFYLRDSLPKYLLWLMPQPSTPSAAVGDVNRNLRSGADLIKLFTGSYVEHATVKPMRLSIAAAAVAAAHAQGRLVFAHESDLQGVEVALASGVDVLAHAPDTTDGIDDALIARMARQVTLAPTLKMFATTVTTRPSYLDPIEGVVRRFHALGGRLIFGTDVGYMHDYTTAGEFTALARCGLTPTDILRMLTTEPAHLFGVSHEKGTLEPGKLADFVLLASDPATDITAFAHILATVRTGQVLWQAPSSVSEIPTIPTPHEASIN